MISCGCRFDEDGVVDDIDESDELAAEPFGVDGSGTLTERVSLGGVEVILHYADVPLSDITTIEGIRCTTPLRTVIDLAPEMEPHQFATMVHDCLDRRLFTVDDAFTRLRQPDMATHRGAEIVTRFLSGQAPT